MNDYIGVIGIFLLNISMLPQIIRIMRLRSSTAISIINVSLAIMGLMIMLGKAAYEHSAFFTMNYAIAVILEVAFLAITLYYRHPKHKKGIKR